MEKSRAICNQIFTRLRELITKLTQCPKYSFIINTITLKYDPMPEIKRVSIKKREAAQSTPAIKSKRPQNALKIRRIPNVGTAF